MSNGFQLLDQIKSLVENGKLSFLIGAGFGKNINVVYPLWKELLADAIWKKYGTGREEDRKKKEKPLIDKVIRETGLLGVASKIVADAGFHEAVDDYIEQHTPYLDLDQEGKIVLKKAGKILTKNVSLGCHQLLRRLKIKNIYTFNYDNALEFCLGDQRILDKEKEKLASEIEDKKFEKRDIEEEYAQFQKELESSSSDMTQSKESSQVSRQEDVNTTVGEDVLKNKTDEILNRLKQTNADLINMQSRLREVDRKLEDSYLVVTNSSDIALTDEGRNIYKIHGSLRKDPGEEFGFDGDKHTQYIITQEDYTSYEQKHGAFVHLMRIDLLRKQFCIVGVSGGDANFLAWIGWVKDVLDKTGRETGVEKRSYFIHAGNEDMSREMKQMLNNHFIVPVVLKDVFPEAKDDTERVKCFLEYVQPSINNTSRLVDMWKGIDRRTLESGQTINIDDRKLTDLCKLSASIVFHKPMSVVHYAAVDVVDSGFRYLNTADEKKLKLWLAASLCSLLPARPSMLARAESMVKKSTDMFVRASFSDVTRRAMLLYAPTKLTKKELAMDAYTTLLRHLFLYDFPSKKDFDYTCVTGLDIVRKYSLQMLLFGEHNDEIKAEDLVMKFASPQELVLANDWLEWLVGSNTIPIGKVARKYEKDYGTYHLSDYIDCYLREMREKKEPDSFGDVTERFYIDGRPSGYENAAVILNTFVELGVTFAGHTVIGDNDWIDVIRELMSFHPYPLVFYTIARESKDNVIKRAVQELIYDGRNCQIASDILRRLLMALCSKNMPQRLAEPMARFTGYLFTAVPQTKWNKIFRENVKAYLDYADKESNYNAQRALYWMVSAGVERIRDKQLKLNLLERVLKTPQNNRRNNNSLNALAIAASTGLTARDFEPLAVKMVSSVTKKEDYLYDYILMNLSSLLNKENLLKISGVLEKIALRDNQLAVAYAYKVKTLPDKAADFKEKLVQRKDVWQSGITETGAHMGEGQVKISLVDKIIHFDDAQVQHIYTDMTETLEKVNGLLNRPNRRVEDMGMLSSENAYREMVMDMLRFVHRHQKVLGKNQNYNDVLTELETTYRRCCFNKDIVQMIADDEMGRAIRGLMLRAEIDSIDKYSVEYKMLLDSLLARNSKYVNFLFLHMSWMMKEHKDFFCREEFIKLLIAAQDIYAAYFREDNQKRWDIKGCEKETAESCLVTISDVLTKWGFAHPFWKEYKKKYFAKE